MGAFWPGAYFGPKYLIFHKAITLQLSVPNSTFQFYFFHHYHQFEIMASFWRLSSKKELIKQEVDH